MVLPPPPIQGVGNAAGATMQVQLRDGTFDLAKLQNIVQAMVDERARASRACNAVIAPYRATVPQYIVEVDRVKTQTLGLTVNQVFDALARLSRRELCRSVQQVRPHVPDLCAGGFAIPLAHRRTSTC